MSGRAKSKVSKALVQMAAEMKRKAKEQRQQQIRNVANEDDPPVLSVDRFMAQHGDYEPAGKFNGARNVLVNRGGTPIARWKRDGHLSETQQAAIAHCIRLWEIVSSSGKLVANLDRTVFGCPGDGHPMEVEARSDLARMKAYFTPKLWDVWENVVRFDEPAGVAGSRLERAASARELAARHAVQFVADIIAMKERLSY